MGGWGDGFGLVADLKARRGHAGCAMESPMTLCTSPAMPYEMHSLDPRWTIPCSRPRPPQGCWQRRVMLRLDCEALLVPGTRPRPRARSRGAGPPTP